MRCFLAAWPDASARSRCAELTEALRPRSDHGRVMRAENLHLTLAFIGDLPDEAGTRVATACAQMPPLRCDWQLDAIGFFARSRVLWAGGAVTRELDVIADAARALLDGLGVDYDRKPFVPHVTLLRDVRRFDGPRDITPPIPWPIREVGLYRSGRDDKGARYFRVAPA
jgi:RNA 2',3'-cyclic 3'-phosphodiesterase